MINDIKSELKYVLKGKTLDALMPPLVYALLAPRLSIIMAAGISIVFSAMLFLYRWVKKQKKFYALTGVLGVSVASGYAILFQNPSAYFLGSILSSAGLTLLCFISLVFSRPIAAWLSHLTRGWPIKWFWRDDIRPAYSEVTFAWMLLLILRVSVKWLFIKTYSVESNALVNFILGWPSIILVLSLTYMYGMWRLKKLKGPSVDEFLQNTPRPWMGQKKGF